MANHGTIARNNKMRPTDNPTLLAKFRDDELEKCLGLYDVKLDKLMAQKELMLQNLGVQQAALEEVDVTINNIDASRTLLEQQAYVSPEAIRKRNRRRQRELWENATGGRQLVFDDLDGSVLVEEPPTLADIDTSIVVANSRRFPVGGRRAWYGNYMSRVAPRHRDLWNRQLALFPDAQYL